MNLKTKIMNTELAQEMTNNLPHFHGSEQMWEHRTIVGRMFLTDGANYVREKAQARWLFDIIHSYQRQLRGQQFQVWTLEKVNDTAFIVTCTDGNNVKLVSQKIRFSDFPLNSITLWKVDEVVLLPSEY